MKVIILEVNLELYRVFYEVAKYKNISRAADSMHISQPAITQSIKKLESLLGLPLFYRKNKGVELTEEGENLLEYIKNSIETMSNAENVFSQYISLDRGKIRIGGWDTLINNLLMPIIKKFLEKYPNIEVATYTGTTENLLQRLANGELDILVCNLPENMKKYRDVEFLPIKNAKYCFFGSVEYIKDNKIKRVTDIKENQLILPNRMTTRGKILEEFCKQNEMDKMKGNYEITTIDVMRSFVLNNLGIGFTNKEDIQDLLKDKKVKVISEIEDESIQEGFAVLKRTSMNNCTYQFVKDIKRYYKI